MALADWKLKYCVPACLIMTLAGLYAIMWFYPKSVFHVAKHVDLARAIVWVADTASLGGGHRIHIAYCLSDP